MADFRQAEKKTGRNEGGYSDSVSDAGGETYRGIATVFNPSWPGWPRVRAARAQVAGPRGGRLPREDWKKVDALLAADAVLDRQVSDVYKAEYWDKLGLDLFPSQILADVLYDAAVNCGTGKPALWLQKALNALNDQGKLYPDLTEDSGVGPKTLAVAVDFQKRWPDRVPILAAAVLGQRITFHMERTRERPDQEEYARSWFGRVARQMGELS